MQLSSKTLLLILWLLLSSLLSYHNHPHYDYDYDYDDDDGDDPSSLL